MPVAASTTRQRFGSTRVSERRASNESALLPLPGLPQGVGGVLNLAELDGEAVRVNVPAYPECNVGDRITVIWKQHGSDTETIRRYAYLSDASGNRGDAPHEIRVWPLWALPPGDYDVQYAVTSRTGNVSQSEAAHVAVVGTPQAPTVITGGVIQAELFGVYRPGLIGAWLVPGAYSIASSGDVLVQSLASYSTEGASTANAVLRLYKNDEVDPFGSIVSDDSGIGWTPSIDKPSALVRGDLISVRLDGAQDAMLFLVLAL